MVSMPAAGNLLGSLGSLGSLGFLGAVRAVACVAAVAGMSGGPDPSYRERPANRFGPIAGAVQWFQLSFGDLKCLGQKRGA